MSGKLCYFYVAGVTVPKMGNRGEEALHRGHNP